MDKATLAGLMLALGGILLGLLLEGRQSGPGAAADRSHDRVRRDNGRDPDPIPAVRSSSAGSGGWRIVFVEPAQNAQATVTALVKYANQARREGLVSLDSETGKVQDPFLRRALMLAVDGTESQELRKIMELELDNKEEEEEKIPQLFESAGGFSPTIGIIGAVLGPDPGDAAPRQNR